MFLSLKKRTTHIKIVMKKITRSQDNSMMRKVTLELLVNMIRRRWIIISTMVRTIILLITIYLIN